MNGAAIPAADICLMNALRVMGVFMTIAPLTFVPQLMGRPIRAAVILRHLNTKPVCNRPEQGSKQSGFFVNFAFSAV